jgi:NAD(P)-dependent dehydrogenase (short-subunit alcohol dehydrogenase family)
MATSLAVEWAKKGVRVNVLSPGYMLTKLTKTILANDQELKVGRLYFVAVTLTLRCTENMGEPYSYGEGAALFRVVHVRC